MIPDQFLGSIKKGIVDSLDSGPLIGYPLTDIKVSLIGGSYHEEESTEMAFGIAAAMAIRRATSEAQPKLLEPIMKLEVITPEEYIGDVIADLNQRGLRSKYLVIVGGGVVTQELADQFGADGYGKDFTAAVQVAKELLS